MSTTTSFDRWLSQCRFVSAMHGMAPPSYWELDTAATEWLRLFDAGETPTRACLAMFRARRVAVLHRAQESVINQTIRECM